MAKGCAGKVGTAGFTILEVMIAMSILSVALLATAYSMQRSQLNSRSADLSADMASLSATFLTLFTTPKACETALRQKTIDLTHLPQPLDSLELPGGAIAKVGLPTTGLQVTALEVSKLLEFDIEVRGLEHRHLVEIHLKTRKVAGTERLPGSNEFDKRFVVPIWQDVSTKQVTRCY